MLTLTEKAKAGGDLMNSKRNLSLNQMHDLMTEAKSAGSDSVFDAIIKAYYAGFYQGYMQHKAEVKRERTCHK